MIIDILSKIEDFYNIPILQFINKFSLDSFPKKRTFECKKCNTIMFSYISSCVIGGCIYCSKKDLCEECGRENFLQKTEACADDWECCTKKICYNKCIYVCDVCNTTFHDSGDIYIIDNDESDDEKTTTDQELFFESDSECESECDCENGCKEMENGEKHTSKFICNACNGKKDNIYASRPKIWYGMSVDEYIKKYG